MRKALLFIPSLTFLLAMGLDACKEPVQLNVQISTDLRCRDDAAIADNTSIRDVAIYAGPNEASVRDQVQRGQPSAIISPCARDVATGSMGDLWLVRQTSNEPVIAVVAGLSQLKSGTRTEKSATECTLSGSALTSAEPNCLFAVKKLRYSEDNPSGQVRVRLQAGCVGLTCAAGQVCEDGVCQTLMTTPSEPSGTPPSLPPVDVGVDATVVEPPFVCRGSRPEASGSSMCMGDAPACIQVNDGTVRCTKRVVAGCESPCCSASPLGTASSGGTSGSGAPDGGSGSSSGASSSSSSSSASSASSSGGSSGTGTQLVCCLVRVNETLLPLGAPKPSGECAQRACFSEKECADCGAVLDPAKGWGECRPGF